MSLYLNTIKYARKTNWLLVQALRLGEGGNAHGLRDMRDRAIAQARRFR